MKINNGFVLLFTAAIAAVFLTRNSQASNLDSRYAGTIEEGDFTFSFDTAPIVSEWDNLNIMADINTPVEEPFFISDAGIEALKLREGFSATPYVDARGHSIGYGHFILPNEVDLLTNIDQETANTLLLDDLMWAVNAVIEAIDVPITQNQFDALVSFCYNVGKNAFAKSTLVKKINASDPTAVNEFGRWVYSMGDVNSSLMVRRTSEAQQFLA